MTANSEREAFERWANRISEHSIITTLEDNVYVHRDARIAWAAWQAARSTPSPRSVDGEADWRIAFFDRHNEAAKAKGYHGIAEVVEQAKTITLRDELGEIARPAPAAVCACGPYCQDLGHGNCRYATANSAEVIGTLHKLASDLLAQCDALQVAGAPRAIVADLRVIAMHVHREGRLLQPETTPVRLVATGAPEHEDPVARQWAAGVARARGDGVE
jgi:hypothetical protein